jgi:hypothetical protein
MVMGKVRIFTQEEETIIHNYYKAKRLKMTEGANEGYGTFEDILVVNGSGVSVDRNRMGDDGAFLDVEDVSKEYEEMEWEDGLEL